MGQTKLSTSESKLHNSQQGHYEGHSSLVSRNITILGRRTSIRLEPEMWQALNDIAERECCSVHDICTLVNVCKKDKTSFTAAIRVFLMLYYRAASTEQGHEKAGHGDFRYMMMRARVPDDCRDFFEKKHGVRLSSAASRAMASMNDNLHTH